MPATPLGIRNVGKHTKETESFKTASSKVAASWFCQAGQVHGDAAAGTVIVPGFGQVQGWQFLLDPLAVQQQFNFGAIKAIQVAAYLANSVIASDASTFYVPGRVFVYLDSTGQLFIFGPKNTIIGSEVANQGYATENLISAVEGTASGKCVVTFEQDNESTHLQTLNAQQLYITLNNYENQAVAD